MFSVERSKGYAFMKLWSTSIYSLYLFKFLIVFLSFGELKVPKKWKSHKFCIPEHESLEWKRYLNAVKKHIIITQFPWDWFQGPSESCSVVSDSLQPHMLYSPWNSLGQNTGVGSEGKLHGSRQPGVKTPLQVLPTILGKTKNSLTRRKNRP